MGLPVRIHRRAALRLLASTAGLSLLAGCGLAPAARPSPSSGGAAASSDQPRTGGRLRVGVGAEPANLDGHNLALPQRDFMWLFFDRLVALDQKGAPQPMLAARWELSPDARQMKMNLRKGVMLHSGREMTSQDVKWSLDRTHDPKSGNGTLGAYTANLKEVEAPDPATVVLNFAQPWPAVFDVLEIVNVIDSQSDVKARPVGTGPFAFVEYVQGDHLRMAKNKSYWQSGKPYLDELLVQFSKDQQALVVQLESGTLDVADAPPNPDSVRLQKDAKYQVISDALTGTYYLMAFNVRNAPFDNKKVRQALNYALDRKRIVETALSGFGDPRIEIWPATSASYDPAQAHVYDFDLDRARAMLAEAGAANLETELTWRTNASEAQLIAQIYQADLAKIGVKLTLNPLDPTTWNDYTVTGKFKGMTIAIANSANLSMSAATVGTWYSPENGITGYRNPAWADLSSRVLKETDPAKQKPLSVELNQFLLDQSWVMPLASLPPKVLARANVRGLSFNQHETATYYDAWLA